MSDEWGPEDIAKLDAQFNSPMEKPTEYPPFPVANADGTPKYYDLKIESVDVNHGTKYQSTEPEDSFAFVLKIQEEAHSKLQIFFNTPMVMKRYDANYKKSPNGMNKLLELWTKCGKAELPIGQSANVKELIGCELRAELELKPNGYPKVARLFLKK